MLLTLAEAYSGTVDLPAVESSGTACCDLSLSEALVAQEPDLAKELFDLVQRHLPGIWQYLVPQIKDNVWIDAWLAGGRDLNLGVVLVTNPEIQALNRDYRHKDVPTDVLTFTLLDDAAEGSGLMALPELALGEIYISVDWAQAVLCNKPEDREAAALNFYDSLPLIILDRLVHGCLHLLGIHHDTMPAYNRVVTIQRTVINALTEPTD